MKLTCHVCDREFDYAAKEYRRQTKKGRDTFFCSRSCTCRNNNANRTPETQSKISQALSERSKGNQYNRKGQFTYYLNKARHRKYDCDIDEQHLQEIWDGRCALSGVEITLKDGRNTPLTASLDRKDSSLGYVKGNVQFVAYAINLAKNSFTDEEARQFIAALRS